MWPFKKVEESPEEQIETAKRRAKKARRDLAKITLAARAFHLEWPLSDRTDFILAYYNDGLFADHLAGISDLRDLIFDEQNNCVLDTLFDEDVPAGGCGHPYTLADFRPARHSGTLNTASSHSGHRDVEIPYSGWCPPGGGISDVNDINRQVETGKMFDFGSEMFSIGKMF